MDDKDVRRFFGFVQRANGCWLWQGHIEHDYGTFQFDDEAWQAHAVSYLINVGQIPKDMVVRQKCGNLACVRPSHLEVVKKHLWPHVQGKTASISKLSEYDVVEIRRMRKGKKRATLEALARQFGVSSMTIHDVVTGKTWKHVK